MGERGRPPRTGRGRPGKSDEAGHGDDRRRDLVRTGGEVGAGVGGGATAMGAAALLGPWAALVGPLASVGLKRLFARLGIERVFADAGADFAARQMGPREVERVVSAYEVAVRRLAERLHAGEMLRNDGFFPGERAEGQSAADEILEGVLLKARNAYEKRKAERLGELYAWIAVHPEVTRSHANYLIELAGRLTYVQLLLLGFFAMEDRSRFPDWESTGSFTANDMAVVAAIEELGRQELVVRDDNRAVATFSDVNPRRLRTVLNGRLLVDAMGLNAAELEDIAEVRDLLMRLGKIEAPPGTEVKARVDVVVPRGQPPEVQRVKIGQQVVHFERPMLGLADFEGQDDDS